MAGTGLHWAAMGCRCGLVTNGLKVCCEPVGLSIYVLIGVFPEQSDVLYKFPE